MHAGECAAYPAPLVQSLLPRLRNIVVAVDLCDSAQIPPLELVLRHVAEGLRQGAGGTQARLVVLGLVDPERTWAMEVSIADLEQLVLPVRAAAPVHVTIQVVRFA